MDRINLYKQIVWERLYRIGVSKKLFNPRPLNDLPSQRKYRTFFGEEIIDAHSGNEMIKQAILSKKPYFIARIGTIEMGGGTGIS